MAQTRTDAILGAAVIAAAVWFVVYAGQIAGLGQARAGYELTASFRSVEGVRVGADVRLGGVRIGSVGAMTLDPDSLRAELRLRIRDGIALPEDTLAVVATEGLLGGAFIELLPGGAPFDLAPGDRIEQTQSAVSLVTLLLRAVSGGDGAP
ncbi:outer membrane lipid asymmetry maintenance protein MlaD [Rhodobaculum claviforme]|uniref:Outer membrane lipid asymmetry maintenance protein MlaD n=2 Tax=Rhodobaculum claviforme TaxID=1549854 RepID=A0A934WJC5_9RHOB|nr:outer membrane lipid asymmetry maintenance protein MlaD [Rhodobaculum claviforme]MBK5927901.1 outer membrane lipid asymmetry maintenance protein MlaD [Rhodobaculum claviforme]